MKFSCIFLITFWFTLYISEKSTAMRVDNVVIQPDDEGFNDFIEKSSETDTSGDENFVIRPDDEGLNVISETNPETGSSDIVIQPDDEGFNVISETNPETGSSDFVIQPADEDFNDFSETNPETGFSDMQRKGKKSKSIRNCLDLKNQGKSSGTHLITPCDDTPTKVVKVYCDMDSDRGGWTVIQRRDNYPQQQAFNQTWYEYAMGFGDVSKDFWLGNDNIHCLSQQKPNEIRFDLEYWNGTTGFANYGFFYVDDRTHKYRMDVQNYTGNIGDRFHYQGNSSFSTFDQDNDHWYSGQCASVYDKVGWWFGYCWNTLLNGRYNSTVYWGPLVKKSEMKIRPRH